MSCPEYYKLHDGREFADLLKQELSAILTPKVDVYTAHCIMSAMEHRYRRGKKEGETETDQQAEEWWIKTAIDNSEHDILTRHVISVCKEVVDTERLLYSCREAGILDLREV